ncbi:ribonuclease H-like domain-containing protein [Tanacetum coccineum]|uniref:Ribonuclease H-like domain-containing protein n=1 Tax=Tanacetum coccineum TaxID=301880 RepID=A0ABQ5CC52_9ASTR
MSFVTCNKLRSLELDVSMGHSYGVKAAAAPTHSAFIGAASSGSKLNYSNQQSIPSGFQTSVRSDSIMECVLHSFVAENEPDQDMIYEDFDQVDQLEMEELDLKWQMAMLSLRINRFEKKAGRKMNYNNQQPARFDRRKVRCYKCLQLGHFARECNVKTVDDKARYSFFKSSEVKTDEPKALVSVDSMVNWSDHAAENKTGEVEKVYGMMAGLHSDNGGTDVSDAAAEFAMMGISPKAFQMLHKQKRKNGSMFEATLAKFDKWKEYFGKDEVFDLSTPSVFDPEPVEEDKPLYSWFVKAGEMHVVPPSITGTYMPTSYKSDVEDTQLRDTNVPVIQLKTKDFPPAVDIKTLSKSDVEDPNSTSGNPSFSCLENVKSPRIFYSVPCNSKAASVSAGSRNSPASVPAGRSDSAVGEKQTSQDDGILLLRPLQVTLWRNKRPQFWGPRSMSGTRKACDFVQIKGGIVNLEVEMHFNLFSVITNCDKRTKFSYRTMLCLVLSEEFQLPDKNQVKDGSCELQNYPKVSKEEFIALIENQLNKKVKGIRCDNGTEFKNTKLIELCGEKGIKRDYSNPRTPQQNGLLRGK